MVEGFSIQRRLGDRPMWVLVGDLDIESVGTAFGVLTTEIDGASGDVRLDVGRLAFIGTAGLDMLVELAHGLAPRGRRLVLTTPPHAIQRAAELVGVELVPVAGGFVVPTERSSRVPGRSGHWARDTVRPTAPEVVDERSGAPTT